MKTNLKFIVIAFFTIAITACSTEDGKDGEQGIPGQDGNANVTSYHFENISFPEGVSAPYNIPAITKEILDNGAVLGFVKNLGNTKWYPLPYLLTDIHISIFFIDEGKLTIISTAQTDVLDFRVVVIKGNPENGGKIGEGKSGSQAIYEELKTADVNLNNYEEVVNYYNSKI